MKAVSMFLSLALAVVPTALTAQTLSPNLNLVDEEAAAGGAGGQGKSPAKNATVAEGPLSRVAFGVGVSPLGIGLQASTNITSHFNLRATGNIFKYSTNFTTNGFVSNAQLNLASAGLALDVYPFRLGFRVSPGLLLYNGNQLSATSAVEGGASFTLNHQTFYSDNADPLSATGSLNLNTTKPAFTITTGWGNTIPRKGGHLSFPFEVGVAVSGAPALNVNLAGSACYQGQTQCAPVTGSSAIATQIQSDLASQVAKWNSDLNPLKVYPIISFGVAYAFRIR